MTDQSPAYHYAVIGRALKIKAAFETEMKAELTALTRKIDRAVEAHDKRVRA